MENMSQRHDPPKPVGSRSLQCAKGLRFVAENATQPSFQKNVLSIRLCILKAPKHQKGHISLFDRAIYNVLRFLEISVVLI